MFRSLIQNTIQKLKRDPGYRLDSQLDDAALLQVALYRALALTRGLWTRLWLGSSRSIPFVGSGVHLRHPHMIRVGHSVILEDHVTIDALSQNGVVLGDNVTIAKHSTIQCTGVIRNLGVGITIGDNSAIGAYSFLGAQGGITIGHNVIMGPKVSFHAENHRYERIDLPIRQQGETRQGIVVEDDCWIGAGAILLDGVRIGTGSVIAAGSVVTRSVASFSVAAGVPARVLKTRGDQKSDPLS